MLVFAGHFLVTGPTNSAMKLEPQDLKNITDATLTHYNQLAEDFWQGTRGHGLSQNIEAMLQHT